MKNLLRPYVVMALLLCCLGAHAQTNIPGKIIRAASLSASNTILDPVAPLGYTSKTTAGFLGDDVGNAKLGFKPLPAFSNEPFGDLRRGPSHSFSDFVPDSNGTGVYFYYDNVGNNLLVRMRLGGLVPGAKGYSLLIDADGRFGASGPNADPNYQPATTGVNGNPGFEIEVDLFTQNSGNPGVAVYNVDGLSAAGSAAATFNDWLAYSQTSIAGTSDNGDPDFFIDFYVPLTALQAAYPALNASTPLRFSATTVMAPQPAIGGPKSDIYGLKDDNYSNTNTQYEAYINNLPQVTLTDLTGPSTTYPVTRCTNAPVITTTSLSAGSVTVSGTWTKSSLTGTEASPVTTIKIYKIAAGTSTPTLAVTMSPISIASGGSWTSPSFTVSAGEIIYATAKTATENECLRSNSVQVTSTCNSSNIPPTPTIPVCVGGASSGTFTKGFSGTNYPGTGNTIYLDNLSTGTSLNSVSNTGSSAFQITGSTFTYAGGCNGGANLGGGSYMVYYQNTTTGCKSEPFFFCLPGNGGTAISATPAVTPVISSALTPGTTRIAGTGEAGAKTWLYVDGVVDPQSPVTNASDGSFQFVGLNLVQGQQVYVRSTYISTTLAQNKCGASTASATVNCYTTPPIVTDTTNTGALQYNVPLSGISAEAVGTTIRVYEVNTGVTPNTYTLVATTTVKSGGVWATTAANGTILASTSATGTFSSLASKTYATTAQNGTCSVSPYSANLATASGLTSGRCGAITATTPATSPMSISPATTAVSGTLTGSLTGTVVRVYEDGQLIGTSAATATTSWSATLSPLPYAGNGITTGQIRIGIQEPGKEEQVCTSPSYNVSCSITGASLTFVSCSSGCTEANVTANSKLTYQVTGATLNSYYALRDSITGRGLSAGVWATASSFTLETVPLTGSGSYKIQLVSTSITSTDMCTSGTSARTYTILPISLEAFSGVRIGAANVLSWRSSLEQNASRYEVERSTDGITFSRIGSVQATGSGSNYRFADKDLLQPVYYYRLKLVDLDNRSKYSAVIMLRDNGGSVVMESVRPNPFTDNLAVSLVVNEAQTIRISLVDITGREVVAKTINAIAGAQTLQLQGLQSLGEGLYILQVTGRNLRLQEKVFKGTEN